MLPKEPIPIAKASRTFVAGLEKTHGRKLRRFLARRLPQASADLQDLMQEVYLRLLRIPDTEAIRNPEAYLHTVASHVLHQHALKQAVTAIPIEPDDIATALEASFDTDPYTQVQLQQKFEALGIGLQQYSPRAYATLLMYRCEGLTLEQIGNRFGVTRVMAKKYLIKAMTYCQQHMQSTE